MKNAVLLSIEPKITPHSRILGVGGKSGVFGGKSGVRVSKLSSSTANECPDESYYVLILMLKNSVHKTTLPPNICFLQ